MSRCGCQPGQSPEPCFPVWWLALPALHTRMAIAEGAAALLAALLALHRAWGKPREGALCKLPALPHLSLVPTAILQLLAGGEPG